MNYKEVLAKFDRIAAVKGNDKKPLILEFLKDVDFLKATTYILDSSKTYKMGKVKWPPNPVHFSEGLFTMLDRLDNAKGATKADKEDMAITAAQSPEKFAIVNKILRHKTDAGFTANTINKLSPGLIPYFPYMRSKGIAHLKNITFPCYSQVKADGMYHEREGEAVRSRNGKAMDFSLVNVGKVYKENLMGECLLRKPDGSQKVMDRRDGNAVINTSQHSGLSAEEARRVVTVYWDVDYGDKKATYKERWEYLQNLHVALIECRVVRNMEETWEHYDEVRAQGLEGTILKNFKGLWKDGNSSDQVKLKAVKECELEVFDTMPGLDKYEGMVGALCCRSSCGNLVTNVGMGLKDKDRVREDWPGQHITAQFNEVSKSKNKDTYALSHARLVEPRPDKTEADDLSYILEVKEVKRK